MAFFDWAAPAFAHFGDRWSMRDLDRIAGWLRPYVPEGGSLVDVGGGTGALAIHLAEALHCRATVLDPTPNMLRYVPARLDVDAVLGVANEMPFEDSSFDAAVVSDAFHHFREQDDAVRELLRVVRPGGGVLVLEFDPSGLFGWLLVRGERLLGEPAAFFRPDELCTFMTERGLPGHCEKTARISYYFLGQVPSG